jgi:hopene-associated glycosyltransferase HpnB
MFLALVSLGVWLYLVALHGRFWSSTPELEPAAAGQTPQVDVIVPARNEAETIGTAIGSLVRQEYTGAFRVILVDDNSDDGTAEAAGTAPNLQIIRLSSKPAGWSGKLWALSQGVAASTAPVLLFADADIEHDPRHLATLVAKLQDSGALMVSEMVRLNCVSLAERALIPAFVYFFQMLYPFSQVNDPKSSVAAAAGGTVLIRSETLARIGGIDAIKHTLIDDVALAKATKRLGPVYLGHSGLASSIRPYPHFVDIWDMIARTAFTQLRFSAAMLLLTLVGLTVVWCVPVAALAFGHGVTRVVSALACLLAVGSYLPTLRRYHCSPIWACALPAIALFYMAATIGSAINYWRGAGARWKNRAYER